MHAHMTSKNIKKNTINIIKVSNLTYSFQIHTHIYPDIHLDYENAINYHCNMLHLHNVEIVSNSKILETRI